MPAFSELQNDKDNIPSISSFIFLNMMYTVICFLCVESSSQLIVPPEDDLLNGFLPLQACFDSMPLLQSCNMHTNKVGADGVLS